MSLVHLSGCCGACGFVFTCPPAPPDGGYSCRGRGALFVCVCRCLDLNSNTCHLWDYEHGTNRSSLCLSFLFCEMGGINSRRKNELIQRVCHGARRIVRGQETAPAVVFFLGSAWMSRQRGESISLDTYAAPALRRALELRGGLRSVTPGVGAWPAGGGPHQEESRPKP